MTQLDGRAAGWPAATGRLPCLPMSTVRPFPTLCPRHPCYIDSPFRLAGDETLAGERGTIMWAGETPRRGELHRQDCHDLYLRTDS